MPPFITNGWQEQPCARQGLICITAGRAWLWWPHHIQKMALPNPSPCLLILHSFHSLLYGIHSLSLREALDGKELCECKILLLCSLWKQNKKQTNKKLELDAWGIICLFGVSDSQFLPVLSELLLLEGWGCQAGGHRVSGNHDSNFHGSLFFLYVLFLKM